MTEPITATVRSVRDFVPRKVRCDVASGSRKFLRCVTVLRTVRRVVPTLLLPRSRWTVGATWQRIAEEERKRELEELTND